MELEIFDVALWLYVLRKAIEFCRKAKEIIDGVIQEIEAFSETKEKIKKELNKILPKIIAFLRSACQAFKVQKSSSNIEIKEVVNIPKIFFENKSEILNHDEFEDKTITERIVNQVNEALSCRELSYILASPTQKKEKLVGSINSSLNERGINYIVVNNKKSDTFSSEKELYEKIRKAIYHELEYILSSSIANNNITGNGVTNRAMDESPDKIFSSYVTKILDNNIINDLVIVINGLDIKIDQLAIQDVFLVKQKFFNVINQFYSKRNQNQNYKKLNFVLIDSIYLEDDTDAIDQDKTIFVGWRAKLDDISKPRIKILASLPKEYFKNELNIEVLLREIWGWTNGHPLQTLNIFRQIINEKNLTITDSEADFVERIVTELYSIKDQ